MSFWFISTKWKYIFTTSVQNQNFYKILAININFMEKGENNFRCQPTHDELTMKHLSESNILLGFMIFAYLDSIM